MHNLINYAWLPILFFFGNISAQETETTSQNFPKRSYTTVPIGAKEAPKIDGELTEPAWNLVEWTTDYVEFEPDNATPPTEQTKMKILYDEKNLYVAFKCYQKNIATGTAFTTETTN